MNWALMALSLVGGFILILIICWVLAPKSRTDSQLENEMARALFKREREKREAERPPAHDDFDPNSRDPMEPVTQVITEDAQMRLDRDIEEQARRALSAHPPKKRASRKRKATPKRKKQEPKKPKTLWERLEKPDLE